MVNKSIHLSWLLRHCKEVGEQVDEKGFISLDSLNSISHHKYTPTELYDHVKKDKKGRFETYEENGKIYIRAIQGHSFPVKNPEYTLESDVKTMFHITHHDHVNSILEKGLLKMGRQYIHFYPTLEEARITKLRDTPLEVTVPPNVNVYRTANGYFLCDTEIPPEYVNVVKK